MKPDILRNYVIRIKKSDIEAFKEIFKYLNDNIYHFLVYKVHDSKVAEDILQDVFISFWENRRKLNKNKSVISYIYTIANNFALNYLRHQTIVHKYQLKYNQAESEISVHEILENKELSEYINKAIERLSDKVKTVFLMSRIENLSYKEIAERLGISISTVESHIVKALKCIRESIPENYLKNM